MRIAVNKYVEVFLLVGNLATTALVIGVEQDVYVRSALVDMYAKCGFIYEAKALFCKMSERSTVTWNSMIFGYANHGYCNEAIELFNEMKLEDDKKLDYLTFIAVLTACCHAGMIELGEGLFSLMQEKYEIVPRLEHYACMVDLPSRAGKLTEAYDLIKAMPTEPDLFVWGALLGACRNHGNIDLAEVAAKYLSELEPESAGNSLLLSSLYAGSGNWGECCKVEENDEEKQVRETSGMQLDGSCLIYENGPRRKILDKFQGKGSSELIPESFHHTFFAGAIVDLFYADVCSQYTCRFQCR